MLSSQYPYFQSQKPYQGSSVTQVESVSCSKVYVSKVIASLKSAAVALHQGATAEPIAFRKGIIHVR